MKLDLHNHTMYSDSRATPEQLVRRGKEIGIIPAITDHNTMAAEKRAREASKKYGWPFIIGEEILTTEGEISGLMLNEEIPKKLSPGETLDRIREQGALSYATHPFDMNEGPLSRNCIGKNEEILKKVDIIEVINVRSAWKSDAKALEFAKRNRKIVGAGSDSHWLRAFGLAYVETKDAEIDTPKDLLKAVERGTPFLVRRVTKFERVYNRMLRNLKKALKG